MDGDFFDALSNPYRRQIVRMLKWGNYSVNEITKALEISQPSVSRHLDVLKKANLVVAERRANQIIYSLNLSVMQEFVGKMVEFLDDMKDLKEVRKYESNKGAFIKVCKHCAVLHMMSINYGVPVGKTCVVSEIQEYTAGSIPLAAEQVLQIIAVIPSLYNRIVDLRSFNVDPGNDVRVDLTQYSKIHLRPNRVVLIRKCFCPGWLVDNGWLWFSSFLWKQNHVTDILVSRFTGVILGSNHPYLPCRKRHNCEKNGCEAA